jgi:hypothetical protein
VVGLLAGEEVGEGVVDGFIEGLVEGNIYLRHGIDILFTQGKYST